MGAPAGYCTNSNANVLLAHGDDTAAGRCCRVVRGISEESTTEIELYNTGLRELMIIFDWDDTLICSTQIKAHRHPSPQEMRMLEEAAIRLLQMSLALGKTTIVTNANLCWVHATASLFMPAVLPVLNLIEVLSARQVYEPKFPGDASAWKMQAFRDLVTMQVENGMRGSNSARSTSRSLDTSESARGHLPKDQGYTGLNLIVLGDSMAEIQAGRSAVDGCGHSESIVKTVKFKEMPTALELEAQLRLVTRHLRGLVAEEKSGSKTLVHGSLTGWSIRDAGKSSLLNLF